MQVKQECLEEAEHDEFDDLTLEELKSLLDNFKNLAKPEQMDLIQYMRKLETTNPEKVKLLKQAGAAGGASNQAPPSNSEDSAKKSWVPERQSEPGTFKPAPTAPTQGPGSNISNPASSAAGPTNIQASNSGLATISIFCLCFFIEN